MSIKLYTGLPGSGKTYRVVKELIDQYQEEYCIIHNIDGLRGDAFKKDTYIKSYSQFNNELKVKTEELFTLEMQRSIVDELKGRYKKNVLIVVDECDKIGMDKDNASIKEWLSMHRHIGQDIILITQSSYNIHRSYNHLIEVEIQAKKGYVFTSFIYSWLAQGSRFKTDRLKKEKRIFKAYRSFEHGEKKKKTTSLWRWIFVIGIFAVVGMTYTIFFMFPNQAKKVEKINQRLSGASMIEKSQESMVNETVHDEDIEIRYHFAGVIHGNPMLSDQWGNLYRQEVIEHAELFHFDSNYRKVDILNPETGIKTYVNEYITVGNHGASALSQRESKRAQNRRREIWIDIR